MNNFAYKNISLLNQKHFVFDEKSNIAFSVTIQQPQFATCIAIWESIPLDEIKMYKLYIAVCSPGIWLDGL